MGKKLWSHSDVWELLNLNILLISAKIIVVVKEIDVRFSIATLVSFNVFLVTFTVSIANIMADTLRTQTSRKR